MSWVKVRGAPVYSVFLWLADTVLVAESGRFIPEISSIISIIYLYSKSTDEVGQIAWLAADVAASHLIDGGRHSCEKHVLKLEGANGLEKQLSSRFEARSLLSYYYILIIVFVNATCSVSSKGAKTR